MKVHMNLKFNDNLGAFTYFFFNKESLILSSASKVP